MTVLRRWAVAVLALLPMSCGYQAGSLTRPEYRRVHVELFTNQTFFRDLEVVLTSQVEREASSRPGIFIAPRQEADILLRGVIEDFQQRVLAEDDRDRVRESSATTTVRIQILSARTGRLLDEYSIRDRAEFFLGRGENLASATTESFFDLARRVVDGLETELERPSRRTEGRPDNERPDGGSANSDIDLDS